MSEWEIRVGDAEREVALSALGDHMSDGRLDIEEYGERTAKVATAKTRGDLVALFADLPEPKPRFGSGPVAPATPPPYQPAVAPATQPAAGGWENRPAAQRAFAALVPISGILSLVLFLFLLKGFWPIFFLPLLVTVVGGSLWGDDWRRDRRDHERRRNRNRGWY